MIYITTGFSPKMLPEQGLSIDFVPVDKVHAAAMLRSPFISIINASHKVNKLLIAQLVSDTKVVITDTQPRIELSKNDNLLIIKPGTDGIDYWVGHCYSLLENGND